MSSWYAKGRGGKGGKGGSKGGWRPPMQGAAGRTMSWKRQKLDDKDALPVLAHKQELLRLLSSETVVIVSGDTGCGKSTQVPQFLLDADPANRVVVTQPRRLAARALAERVSHERGSVVGRTIGYAVSRDKVTTLGSTRCTFMTTGLLLQLLVFRPTDVLGAYSHIVIDEAHERDVDLDLLLLLLRRVMRAQAAGVSASAQSKPLPSSTEAGASVAAGSNGSEASPPNSRLSLVVMSATIDSSAFAEYLKGCSPPGEADELGVPRAAPVLQVGSRCHEVKAYGIQELLQHLSKLGPPAVTVEGPTGPFNPATGVSSLPGKSGSSTAAKLHPTLFGLCEFILRLLMEDKLLSALPGLPPGLAAKGSVLIFLPGFAEIQECMKTLQRAGLVDAGLLILPLHSLQDSDEQQATLCKAPAGMRKVVLATNIAESSITVADVAIVIDFGLEKLPYYDMRANSDSLLLRHCSRASALQRAGRAGRVAPGVCLRLYPSDWLENDSFMPEYTPAEMQRTSLLNLVLKVKMIDADSPPAELLAEAIQPPANTRVTAALEELLNLGALSGGSHKAKLTPLGRLVAAMPVSAPVGRLLALGEALGCGRQAAIIAASLVLPNPFLQPYTSTATDADDLEAIRAAEEDVSFFKPRLSLLLANGNSDPLCTLALFNAWQDALNKGGPPKAAQYAHSQHASYKRLMEIEHLSRELLQKLRQQRVEYGMLLPPCGASASQPGGPSALILSWLLTFAFLPNIAVSRYSCPPRVKEDILRHNLEPSRTIYCAVRVPSENNNQPHLSRVHLKNVFRSVGEVQQVLISKARVVVDGQVTLQTSAMISFSTSTGAMLALRRVGISGSMAVPLEESATLVGRIRAMTSHRLHLTPLMGHVRLQLPQYPARLSFERLARSTPLVDCEEEVGARLHSVDLDWYSGCALLSDTACDASPRYLLATSWRQHGSKMIAQHASLLPRRPAGAAELMLLVCSRAVRLLAVDGVGVLALVGEREAPTPVSLPWQLSPADVEGINQLRAAVSRTLGASPRGEGESASALQLRIMQLLVAERPPLTPRMAAAAATVQSAPSEPSGEEAESPAEFLPALQLDERYLKAALQRADAKDSLQQGTGGASGSAADAFAEDVELELLDG